MFYWWIIFWIIDTVLLDTMLLCSVLLSFVTLFCVLGYWSVLCYCVTVLLFELLMGHFLSLKLLFWYCVTFRYCVFFLKHLRLPKCICLIYCNEGIWYYVVALFDIILLPYFIISYWSVLVNYLLFCVKTFSYCFICLICLMWSIFSFSTSLSYNHDEHNILKRDRTPRVYKAIKRARITVWMQLLHYVLNQYFNMI